MKPEWCPQGRKGRTLEERLEMLSVPDPMTGCWLWIGTIYSERKPYGRMDVNGHAKQSHRVSYEVHNGKIPDGMVVRHTCDNPACINPQHLIIGTNQDNVDDRNARGRQCQGVNHPNSRFSAADIRAIRASSEDNYTLARRYGVVDTTIRNIKLRITYRSVSDEQNAHAV